MPAMTEDVDFDGPSRLPFPPISREHILHCSYHYWHPKYRSITPKTRLIPLNQAFLDYLRADGIILPSDDSEPTQWSDTDSGVFSASDNQDALTDSDDEDIDVAAGWHEIDRAIKDTIAEYGRVVPKLNWSAPKDATWMNANTMMCNSANDVYLLLKSSDFVTHDLEHAYDDTVTSPGSTLTSDTIPYHLALRKAVGGWNPSVEFRCFVRGRKLLCMCQRDLNHFDFLSKMSNNLRSLIQQFFDIRLRDTFPDENFAFDVYVPQPYDRVWLVDVNPWAPRTDPLLFSWLELLTMPEPPDPISDDQIPDTVRMSMGQNLNDENRKLFEQMQAAAQVFEESHGASEDYDPAGSDDSDVEDVMWLPELRLVHSSDPEAYTFNTPQYSAHKLPRDIVEASQSGEGLREFAKNWEKILAKQQREDEAWGESSEGE